MPELIYPTRTRIRGPILISAASLKELDGILAEQMPILRDVQRQLVDERVGEWLGEDSGRDADTDHNLQQLQANHSEYFIGAGINQAGAIFLKRK